MQSEYAKQFVENEMCIPTEQICYLSDYINDIYLNGTPANRIRRNRILYNPKKGAKFTAMLRSTISEFEWIPLQGMSNEEIKEFMETSKVYVDFGNHPGKDRFPREAVVSGCCIVTGKRGAAKNGIDIPIGDKYKFNDSLDEIDAIHKTICSCMNDYESIYREDFLHYKEQVKHEKTQFVSDALSIFQ